MIFHDFGVPKTHPKSISKSMPKTDRFWTLLGPYFGSLLASRLLQHGFQSSQDGSKTTEGASKTPLICLQGRPSASQDASKTAQDAPKALQELPRRLSEPPRALQERVFETPSHLQELSGGTFQTSSCCPAASSLWRASGLGGIREAQTIRRPQRRVRSSALRFLLTSYLLRI